MKNTKITKDQAIGLMCMESATNMPYRVLNAAGKWAVTEFVSKYAARENIISEWFNKVESIANNCAHDETVIVELLRTMTKSGNPETFSMNDSHFDWMVQEEGTQEPTLPGQAIILFESMTDEQKVSFLKALQNRLPLLDSVVIKLNEADINYDDCTDIDMYVKYFEIEKEECCHACEGTGRSTYDERRPCSVCDGEG